MTTYYLAVHAFEHCNNYAMVASLALESSEYPTREEVFSLLSKYVEARKGLCLFTIQGLNKQGYASDYLYTSFLV